MSEPVTPSIRLAKLSDLPAIVDIYNQAIRSGIATGDLYEFKAQDREDWFAKFDPDSYPIYVIEIEGKIAGYGTLSPYRPGRKAMASIAEISFFLDYGFHNQGLGSKLVQHMIDDCQRIGKKSLLAILLDVNAVSIGLLEKFGFEQWGHFPDVVQLRDQVCGQLIYGLKVST